jgi:hypothetical protein
MDYIHVLHKQSPPIDQPKNGLQNFLGDLGDRKTIVFRTVIGIDER